MNKKINLAIIGCGATAVTLLRSLVDGAIHANMSPFNILVFDLAETFGVGLAYQHDLNNLIINRPLQTMSAHGDYLAEFSHWLEQQSALSDQKIIECSEPGEERSYISRRVFGYYLECLLHSTIEDAKHHGIQVTLLRKEITEIKTVKPFILKSRDHATYIADYVVLCTGNNAPKDIFNLNNTPNYINNPYPMLTQLDAIHPASAIGIIGNSLTAIDVAVSLRKSGHGGPMTMMSRMKAYPRIRGTINRQPLRYLSNAKILATKERKGRFTLRDALRLLRSDLKLINDDWRLLFADNTTDEDFLTFMQAEVAAAGHERKWQSVLSATNQAIELCWHHLDEKCKRLFLNHYNRLWLRNRTPIPTENANALIEMTESGQLQLASALSAIVYDHDQQTYVASFKSGEPLQFDYLINATGPAKQVQPEDTLLYKLVDSGFARKHPFGGLDVDFSTSSLIDKNGKINQHFRLLGHNTSGVYYYTSSLEMIAKRSHKVAENLLLHIKQHASFRHAHNRELGQNQPMFTQQATMLCGYY